MENNKNMRDLYELYLELGHDVFEERIKKPMKLYMHDNGNVISMNALNTIVANAMENSKLGEAGFDEHDIFSPPSIEEKIYTTRKVLIDNVPKSSTKGHFSSPMGLTRRYGFRCGNCVKQSPTTIFSVRRAWAPFRHGKSDRCGSVFGSPLTADVMQTDTWQTPLTAS